MQNCCHKCQSTEGIKTYGVTKEGIIVTKENERLIRRIGPFCNIFLANPIPRIEYYFYFCPKCAKSGKSS